MPVFIGILETNLLIDVIDGRIKSFDRSLYAFPLAWHRETANDCNSGEYLRPCFFFEWSFICNLIKLARCPGMFFSAASNVHSISFSFTRFLIFLLSLRIFVFLVWIVVFCFLFLGVLSERDWYVWPLKSRFEHSGGLSKENLWSLKNFVKKS